MSAREFLRLFGAYIPPIAVVILFSSLIGAFFYLFARERIMAFVPNVGSDIISNILFSLVVVGIGLSASILVYMFSSRGRGAVASTVALIALLPFFIVFVVFFGETLVLTLFRQFPGPLQMVLSIASVYLAVFSVVVLFSQAGSGLRNIVFILYGAIIGAFAGLIIPTLPMVLMLATIAIYDWALMRGSRLREIITEDKQRKGTLQLYYEDSEIQMGIGEFVAYSMLPAHSLFFFDFLTYAICTSLILIGCFINFAILTRVRLIAGIPIPIFLTLTFLILRMAASVA